MPPIYRTEGALVGLAILSTLSGNLLLVGSLANLIVAERTAPPYCDCEAMGLMHLLTEQGRLKLPRHESQKCYPPDNQFGKILNRKD